MRVGSLGPTSVLRFLSFGLPRAPVTPLKMVSETPSEWPPLLHPPSTTLSTTHRRPPLFAYRVIIFFHLFFFCAYFVVETHCVCRRRRCIRLRGIGACPSGCQSPEQPLPAACARQGPE